MFFFSPFLNNVSGNSGCSSEYSNSALSGYLLKVITMVKAGLGTCNGGVVIGNLKITFSNLR